MKNTKGKIKRTAVRLYNQRGIESVSIRQIAAEMKISHGNLMYHFQNIEVLNRALLEDLSAELSTLLSDWKALKLEKNAALEAYISYCVKNRWVYCGKRWLRNQNQGECIEEFEQLEKQFWKYCNVANSDKFLWLTQAWLLTIPLGQKSGLDEFHDEFQEMISEEWAQKAASIKPKTPKTPKPNPQNPPSTQIVQGSLF